MTWHEIVDSADEWPKLDHGFIDIDWLAPPRKYLKVNSPCWVWGFVITVVLYDVEVDHENAG